MSLQTSHRGQELSEINVTPFVDVVLVLLIIFMIAAPLLSQGLDIELPEANAPAITRAEDDVIVTIKKDGSLYLMDEKKPYALEEMGKKIEAVFEHRKKKELLLRADQSTSYGVVVKAIALFKEKGIERVGMVTEEEKKPKEKKR